MGKSSLEYKQLKRLAKKNGVKASGKKSTLKARLRSKGHAVACNKRKSPPFCKKSRHKS